MPIKIYKATKSVNHLRATRTYTGIDAGASQYVLQVGAFSSRTASERNKPTTISNAGLLAIMEKGSPLKNIPARPVIRPALEEQADDIKPILKIIGKLAMQQQRLGFSIVRDREIRKHYRSIGQSLVKAIKSNILDGGEGPDLAYKTLMVQQKDRVDINPYNVTHQLLKSIRYKLIKKSNIQDDIDVLLDFDMSQRYLSNMDKHAGTAGTEHDFMKAIPNQYEGWL